MNIKIYFRADGNAEIGLGHLTRCLAMAQMLQNTFEICFVCKEIVESFASEIARLSFSLLIITDEESFFDRLVPSNIVVLDHYGLDTEYQLRIKQIGCKLVCIDDIHDRLFFADLIINHAPNIQPANYTAQYYTQFATGLDYVLLRPIFLDLAKKSNKINGIETVFICFGGSDFKNITQVAVELIKNDNRFRRIDVVIGASYQYIDKLKQSLHDDERFVLHVDIGSEEMARLIMNTGLAIVPASGILQEVLALGAKTISGIYVENQRNIFENFKLLNAFESAEDFSRPNLGKAIVNAFNSKESTPKRMIDGYSGDRILKLFEQFLLEDQIYLRKVEKDDLLKTYQWASNPAIRKFFFNRKPIEFEDHKKWFNLRLLNPSSFYYIGLFNSEEFGSIRFDVNNDVAVVSYLIDPEFQSKGLGTVLLKKGLELLIGQANVLVRLIQGEVLKENIASVKIFRKLGYSIHLDETAGLFRVEKIIRN